MKEISIFTVFLVLFVCADAQHHDCNFDEFYNSTTDSCVKCPACPAGKGITKGCLCESCISGHYNDGKEGRRYCETCQWCEAMNKIEIKACTVKSDAVCKCPRGKYETRDGDCKECSYCCGENWEQSSRVESACKEQGLGRCICKPSFYCPKKKCPNPTTPIVTTAARTTTGTPIMPTKKKP